jgi:uncharacterized iron-regulated protein
MKIKITECLGKNRVRSVIFAIFVICLAPGCAPTSKKLMITDSSKTYAPGTIIDTRRREAISFDALMADLKEARIVYVGEQHANLAHHAVQLKVMRALAEPHANLMVGMEMFDRSYQAVLDQWSAGKLDRDLFLQKTHWYVNWRYNDDLYMGILDFIKDNNIKLMGLNIPFHIPPKISVGGIFSLSPEEKRYLPAKIDLANDKHRAYVESIFKHHTVRGRDSFEYFYQAQCVWDDGMAEIIADHLDGQKMIVLLGNGHIIYKFGVPERVARRVDARYKTIYLASAGTEIELAAADYIWVTPAKLHGRQHP